MAESSAPFLNSQYVDKSNRWRHRPSEELLKRAFDIIGAGVGLLFLSPLFLWVAWRIRRDSPGPVFYFGPRMGRGGKPFKIAKFRTMYERPQSYSGPRVTAQGDSRITPLGKWLRDTKLNELPQLWNVLKGDMSLVGPRPEDPDIAADWPAEVRQEVLSVRPGVTGPAAVLYRDEENLLQGEQVMDAYLSEILPSKLRLDQLYIRHHSFWGDLDILFWTAIVLIPRLRNAPPGEERLFVGPFSRLMQRHVRWFMTDTAITLVSLALAGVIWRSFGPLNVGLGPSIGLALGFAILFSTINVLLGVNRIDWSKASATDALDLMPGAAMATILAILLDYIYPRWAGVGGDIPIEQILPVLPGGLIAIAAILAVSGFVLARYRSRVITGIASRWVNWRGLDKSTRERILIVGSGESGRYAAWLLSQGRYATAYRVVGFVDDDLYKHDTRIQGLPVLGTRAQIQQIVTRHDIGLIVFAIHNISVEGRRSVLEICQEAGAEVVMFPNIPATLNELWKDNGMILRYMKDEEPGNGPKTERAHPAMVESTGRQHQATAHQLTMEWLNQIEVCAQSGDLEGVQKQIEEMRDKLQN